MLSLAFACPSGANILLLLPLPARFPRRYFSRSIRFPTCERLLCGVVKCACTQLSRWGWAGSPHPTTPLSPKTVGKVRKNSEGGETTSPKFFYQIAPNPLCIFYIPILPLFNFFYKIQKSPVYHSDNKRGIIVLFLYSYTSVFVLPYVPI